MPAWSDHSDEELWATVAFLRAALGHLGAIVSVITKELRGRQYYRAKFERFRALEQVGLAVADLALTIPAPRKTQ